MVDRGALYSPISKAEQRASTLLKEWLTREQCIQYQRLGYFEVTGSHSGNRYRIHPGRQMNVDQLDELQIDQGGCSPMPKGPANCLCAARPAAFNAVDRDLHAVPPHQVRQARRSQA